MRPARPGRVWASCCAIISPNEKPAYTRSAGRSSAVRTPRSRDLVPPGAVDERHALVDRVERPAVEQVRRVDGVAGGAQLIGEGDDAGGQPLRVVEQQDLGHGDLPCGCIECGGAPV